jgi:hypothetical protein
MAGYAFRLRARAFAKPNGFASASLRLADTANVPDMLLSVLTAGVVP